MSISRHARSASYGMVYRAPGAGYGVARMEAPGAGKQQFPRVSDHVVEPETWQEMHDGAIVEVSPALPPHSRTHANLDFVLRGSVAPGYEVDADLLTRTSEKWNFASDSSIRKQGIDPASGVRYLEELAFEIQHTQRQGEVQAKAREMARRGVRRVFLIVVKGDPQGARITAGPVKEWVAAEERWRTLGDGEVITDPCLQAPIPVRALLDMVEARHAVTQALLEDDNPVVERFRRDTYQAGKVAGETEGKADGYRVMLHAILTQRGIALGQAAHARIEACRDPDVLEGWATRALRATSADDLFGDETGSPE